MNQTRSALIATQRRLSSPAGDNTAWQLFNTRGPKSSEIYPDIEQQARETPPGCDVRRDRMRSEVSIESKSSAEPENGVSGQKVDTQSSSLGTQLDNTLRNLQQRISALEARQSSGETDLARPIQSVESETRITLGKVDGEAVMGIVAGLIHELESDPEREASLIRRVEHDLVRHGLATPDQVEVEPSEHNYVTVEVAAARLGITINGVRRILAKAGDRVATKHDEAFVPIEKLFVDLDDLAAYRDENPRGRPTKKKN